MPSQAGSQKHKIWHLGVARERRGDALILGLTGRLGAAAAPEFGFLLEKAIDDGERRIVVDFGGVDYLSSASLAALQTAAGRLVEKEGRIVLCGMDTPVRLVLELAGVFDLFAVEATRNLAIARFEGSA